MSVICDALLVVDFGEREALEAVNRRLTEVDTERHQQFRKLDEDGAGGTKVLCTDVWAGAFNHLIPSEITDAVLAAPWRSPDAVVYILNAYDYDIEMTARTVTEWREQASAKGNVTLTLPNPGSLEAREQGCKCPVLDNSRGAGYLGLEGVFVMRGDCPLHRYDLERPAPTAQSATASGVRGGQDGPLGSSHESEGTK